MKQGKGEASIRSRARWLLVLLIGGVARMGMEESRVDQAEDGRRPR